MPLIARPAHPPWAAAILAALVAAGLPPSATGSTTGADPRLGELERADEHGLLPADYDVERLRVLAAEPAAGRRAGYHRLLDVAYERYRRDVSGGRVAPALADPDWHIPARPADGDPAAAQSPDHAQYRLLQQALVQHLAIERAGGWASVPEGRILRLGERDPRVAALRDRLRAGGDFRAEMQADAWFFDTALEDALRRFQARHGVAVTGQLDERTLGFLNVPAAARAEQLAAVLERWRWLPSAFGPRYVWVNTAGTTLEVFANGQREFAMRTIVGHASRPTPSLASELRQVVFNPTWSVPYTIAVEDLLPRQQQDRLYLARHAIRVFNGSPDAPQELDPANIDWASLGPGRFPYRLRQDAGPANSLGRIKLAMDNPFDIYLHDTPARALFDLASRTLGSGCVRLEDAARFTTFLLAGDREWTAADTEARIASGETTTLNLQHTLPIWIVYLTAWADADGTVNFRRDVYGWDARLLAALRGPRPAAGIAAEAGRPPP